MRFHYDVYDWWVFDVSRRWKAAGALVVVVLVGGAFWQLGSVRESAQVSMVSSDADTDGAATGPGSSGSNGTTEASDDVSVTIATVVSTTAPTTAPATSTSAPITTSTAPAATTTTTTASSGEAVESTSVASEVPAADGSPGYPTSPDGTPLPVLAVFDTETVTLSGQVPSAEAAERLGTLALANSQFPDVELVDSLVVNPAVPISVGVRVLELNSARFPAATAEILPDHARELDRVVDIMNALPNITVLVVGHADQRGDETTNFAISDERARAVVNYLRFLGISPSRLSSRAAGESDLLTVAEDETSLALNRRTEFIFYGLLVE